VRKPLVIAVHVADSSTAYIYLHMQVSSVLAAEARSTASAAAGDHCKVV
jgi:hypothetical protein